MRRKLIVLSGVVLAVFLLFACTDNSSTPSTPTVESGKTATEYYDEGVNQLDLEKHDQAIAYFNKALSMDPSIGEAYLNIGLCHLRDGNYDQCITNSQYAIDTFKKYKSVIASGQTLEELIAICYLNMGLAYIGKARNADSAGNYDQAKSYHKTALKTWEVGIQEDPTYAHLKKIYNEYKTSYK